MSSDTSTSSSSDEEYHITRRPRENRVAKKSTAQQQPTVAYSTRRQAAIAKDYLTRNKKLDAERERFLGNFNPDNSIRERKKLNRKINPPSNVRRPPGALYDDNGIHIATGLDMCDCLNEDCSGCFFECPKCGSQKCGIECRVHRKFIYDQIEYHGYDNVVKNSLLRY